MADRRVDARVIRAALSTLALAVTSSAQIVHVAVELAADPAGRGPAAWTWVRDSALPRLVDGVVPRAPLSVHFDDAGGLAVTPGTGPVTAEVYASFELTLDGVVIARGTCGFDGDARWQTSPIAASVRLPEVIGSLVARFGLEARTGWLELDLPTAIGNLMVAATDGDLVGDALTLGADTCGRVSVVARPDGDGTFVVTGKSGGGLLLPAVLLALADRQATRSPDLTSPRENLERWLLLASSARAEEQEEAARQLSRFEDPRAVRALERLLHQVGIVKLVAMHGLARLGAVDSIGHIAAAADPSDPTAVAVAARAIDKLLPPAIVDALAARSSPPVAAPRPDFESARPEPATRTELLAALAGGVALGLLAAAALRRRAH